ncbi:MAG: hypothetical protein ACP5NP_02270 [Acetobacteraceae bacterium]
MTVAGTPITLACEGWVDREILTRVLTARGLAVGPVHDAGGSSAIDRKLKAYANAAQFSPWLVHRDLDHEECAPGLFRRLVRRPPPGLNLIVPVRQIESWLLADREGCAAFLQIAPALIPEQPETLPDAKQTLVALAGRSRRRVIREGMVPRPQSGRKIGVDYSDLVAEFVATKWSPQRAVAGGARSLAKLLERIDRFRSTGAWTRPA